MVDANLAWAINTVSHGMNNVTGSPELSGFLLLAIVGVALMKLGLDRVEVVFIVLLTVGVVYFGAIIGGTVIWAIVIILAALVIAYAIMRLLGQM